MNRRNLLLTISTGAVASISGCSNLFEPNPDEAPNEPENILLQSWEVGPSDEVSGGTDQRLVILTTLQNTESEYTVAAEIEATVDFDDGGRYSATSQEAIESSSSAERGIELADYDEFNDDDYNGMMGGHLNFQVIIKKGGKIVVDEYFEGKTVAKSS